MNTWTVLAAALFASTGCYMANGDGSTVKSEPAPAQDSGVIGPVEMPSPPAEDTDAGSIPAITFGTACTKDIECTYRGGYCFPRHTPSDAGPDLYHTCTLDCHDGWSRSECIVQHVGRCVQAETASDDDSGTPDAVCVPAN